MRYPLKPIILFISFLLLCCFLSANGQEPLENSCSDGRIKTVQLHREGWVFSNPVIRLGSDEKLVLKFDLLADEPETYWYTFIHCDRNWKESDIFPVMYLEGIAENQLEDYKPSFNTKINYYHYNLTFPNDRVALRLSGNYILKVYRQDDPQRAVITRRFMITEDAAVINPAVTRPSLAAYYNTHQQVTFSVSYPGLKILDPRREISATVIQNGQWANAAMSLPPDFISGSEIRYNSLSETNIFAGRSEYRYFDVRSIRYQSEYVRMTEFVGSYYHVFLVPSENRLGKPYFFWQDFNGKYYVAVQEGRDMDTEADYVRVYFTLPSRYEERDGKLYIFGELSGYSLSPEYEMMYDSGKAQYQGSLLLKQGWYNYEYIFAGNAAAKIEPGMFESNHYETENEYLILVYYRNPRERYDRLIGSAAINSAGRKQDQTVR